MRFPSYQIPEFTPEQNAAYSRNLHELEDSGWHEIGESGKPAFQNSWVNFSAGGIGFASAAFLKDGLGFVHIKGLVKSGVAAVIFTLPTGCRPQGEEVFGVDTDTGHGRVDVAVNGEVTYVSGGTGNFQLSGITFKAI